jgi:hypothetical protein
MGRTRDGSDLGDASGVLVRSGVGYEGDTT